MVRRQQHEGKSRQISIHDVVIWPFVTTKAWNSKRHNTLSESRIKLFGVIIYDGLRFNDHISAMCCRADGQLNALARISKHIDSKSKHIIYNSFVASNFEYRPLVWHYCGQLNDNDKPVKNARALATHYSQCFGIIFLNITKMFDERVLVDKKIKIRDFIGFQNHQ